MIKFKNIGSEDIAYLLAIMIGGIISAIHPEYMGDSLEKTAISIILIKLFW